MQRHDALKALDIYRRAGQQVLPFAIFLLWQWSLHSRFYSYCPFFQAERLSEFYEVCKSLDIGRGERFIKIEQVWVLYLWCLPKLIFLAFYLITVVLYYWLINFCINTEAPSFISTSHGGVCERSSAGFNISQRSGTLMPFINLVLFWMTTDLMYLWMCMHLCIYVFMSVSVCVSPCTWQNTSIISRLVLRHP